LRKRVSSYGLQVKLRVKGVGRRGKGKEVQSAKCKVKNENYEK
jgi:hypothetical protein